MITKLFKYGLLLAIIIIGIAAKIIKQLLILAAIILVIYLIWDGYQYFTSEVTTYDDGKR